MTVAPRCKLNNGLLELYTIGKMGPVDSLLSLPRIYKGTQDEHPAVGYDRTSSVKITADAPIWVSPDGEISGQLPATVTILPRVLNMVMGESPPIE